MKSFPSPLILLYLGLGGTAIALTRDRTVGLTSPRKSYASLTSPSASRSNSVLNALGTFLFAHRVQSLRSSFPATHEKANAIRPSVLRSVGHLAQEESRQTTREVEPDYKWELLSGLETDDLLAKPGLSDSLTSSNFTSEQINDLFKRTRFLFASEEARKTLAQELGKSANQIDEAEVLSQMRRDAEAPEKKSSNKEVSPFPCRLPDRELTRTDFRVFETVGRAAYNKLFKLHEWLIHHEARKSYHKWKNACIHERMDILHEGAIGLCRALRYFDTDRGVKFSTYASWHIRGNILRALRDKDAVVRLPQNLQLDMATMKSARYMYEIENHGQAAPEEVLASNLGWPLSRVRAASEGLHRARTLSIDAPYRFGFDSMEFQLESPDSSDEEATQDIMTSQFMEALNRTTRGRDPQRIKMLRYRYELEDGRQHTLDELAERFNLTYNQVRGAIRTERNFLRREMKHWQKDMEIVTSA